MATSFRWMTAGMVVFERLGILTIHNGTNEQEQVMTAIADDVPRTDESHELQDVHAWPGADGLTLDDVLAAHRGEPGDPGTAEEEVAPTSDPDEIRLFRWLVSCDSGAGWYPVGEFLAVNADAAIERAIEVFGPGGAHQAELIPWDAAPLSKAR